MSVTLQVGVKCLLKNERGEYLLLERNHEKYPEISHMWDIPGGRIEAGTSLLENLKREVLEETGLILTSMPMLIAAQDILKSQGRHIVRLTYVADTTGEPILDGKEHTSYQWISRENLLTIEKLDSYTAEVVITNSAKL